MDRIRSILKTHYSIDADDIIRQQGGWTALAFKVTHGDRAWFLKAFEKNRPSIRDWTARIDLYVPVMRWLLENTRLRGRIPVPLLTQSGACKCEDEARFYMLYEYIPGITIRDGELQTGQVLQLSEILAELHSYGEEIPVDTRAIREDFDVSYLRKLRGYLDGDGIVLPEELAEILAPCRAAMIRLSGVLMRLSDSLKTSSPRMVLCHTDAHNHNVMQSGDQLYLIDWEGIRLAPPETDFMFFVDKPCYPVFLENYKKVHKDFVIDNNALSFYRIRRILEDLWQWIEQLLFDEQDSRQRKHTMDFLGRELAELEAVEELSEAAETKGSKQGRHDG